MVKAVIFDLDGVLIDSERRSVEDNKNFLLQYGITPIQEELLALVGTTDLDNFRYMSQVLDVSYDTARAMLEQYCEEHPLRGPDILRPQVRTLLQYLKKAGLLIALASNSPIDFVDRMLDECEIRPYFSQIVSGRTLERCKPDPAIYFHTARLLSIVPADAVVVEDSPHGVEAAIRAGMRVAGLWDSVLQLDLSAATWQVDSLGQVRQIVEKELQQCLG